MDLPLSAGCSKISPGRLLTAAFSVRGTGAANPRSSNLLGALSSNHYLTNFDFGTAHNGNAIGSGFLLAGGVTGTDFFLVE
jgi:hypothetical protein